MFFLFVYFCLFFMLMYCNVLFYSISLLMISLFLMLKLVLSSSLSVLFFIMVLIVYFGAMMVLIGYVCAICPNIMVIPNLSGLSYVIFFMWFFSVISYSYSYILKFNSVDLISYFYSFSGFFSTVVLLLMLFLVLLMVTSQYSSLVGSLRSIK